MLRDSVLTLLLAAVYVLSAKAGLSLAFVHANATAVWPPTGIALAVLLLFGRRYWPGVFLGALAANATTNVSLATAVGIAVGNTLEAAAGSWAVERFAGGKRCLETPGTIFLFAALAGLGSTMISASIGTVSLGLGGAAAWADFKSIWFTWWLGDAGGDFVVAPLLLAWALFPAPAWTRQKALEAAAASALLLGVGGFVFLDPHSALVYKFLFFPVLLWIAFQFGARETTAAVFVVAGLGIFAAVRFPLMSFGEGPNYFLGVFQAFLAVISVSSLAMTAVVSELRRNERELRRSSGAIEQRFRLLVQGVQEYSIIMLDPEGRVVSWNEGAERIKGYKEAEILGKSFSVFYTPEDEAAGLPHRLLFQARESGKVESEGWRVRKDGTRFWADVAITAVRDESKGLVGFSKVTRDLTERRRAELVLKERTEDLLRSNAELETFATVASHDLQEPLRKIQMFGDRLLARHAASFDAEVKDHLARMRGAAARMSQLIESLLQYSRVTMKARPFEAVDLAAAARDALRDLEARIEQTGATVEVGALPVVRGDPEQLRSLFQNLIANALKFRRPEAAPQVQVYGRLLETGTVEVLVVDNGIGFDEKFLDRIFRPFQRLHARGEFEGNGIGLAICHKIVDRHAGTITARSKPGGGATFVVTLNL
jgi:PAS domain S-box-containing protein